MFQSLTGQPVEVGRKEGVHRPKVDVEIYPKINGYLGLPKLQSLQVHRPPKLHAVYNDTRPRRFLIEWSTTTTPKELNLFRNAIIIERISKHLIVDSFTLKTTSSQEGKATHYVGNQGNEYVVALKTSFQNTVVAESTSGKAIPVSPMEYLEFKITSIEYVGSAVAVTWLITGLRTHEVPIFMVEAYEDKHHPGEEIKTTSRTGLFMNFRAYSVVHMIVKARVGDLVRRDYRALWRGDDAGRISKKKMAGNKAQELAKENGDQVKIFSTPNLASDLENVVRSLEELPVAISKLLDESRTSVRFRVPLETELSTRVSSACESLNSLLLKENESHIVAQEMLSTLNCMGIETPEDLGCFLAVTERDGRLIAELCQLLRTDASQIKNKIENLQRGICLHDQDEDMGELNLRQGRQQGFRGEDDCQEQNKSQMRSFRTADKDRLSETRLRSEPRVRQLESLRMPSQQSHQGMDQQFLAYFQSMACADPGVFKGFENENFHEFIRKFKRKYDNVVRDDATLLEILADDHLKGRAKTMYLSIPQHIKDDGFESVVSQLASMLACDSTAARIKALTALRNLRLRPGQEIADFCVALEKLGRKANPQCTIEERSMEYAQILLENVANWPEYVQLIGALHRIEPKHAYNEIKQLAIGIEQSRRLCTVEKGNTSMETHAWRDRADAYAREDQQAKKNAAQQAESSQREYWHRAPEDPDGGKEPEQFRLQRTSTDERRRCYQCSQYGHRARGCPQRKIEENERVRNSNQTEDSVSDIISRARNLAINSFPNNRGALVGKRTIVQVRLMDKEVPAVLDTGSMISVVPVRILEDAQKRGYDVDKLKVLKTKSEVYDASNNAMTFIGAVRIDVEIEGQKRAVAFHVSRDEENELLLGTNALEDLGVKVVIQGKKRERPKRCDAEVKTVLKSSSSGGKSPLIKAICQESNLVAGKVLWPPRKTHNNRVRGRIEKEQWVSSSADNNLHPRIVDTTQMRKTEGTPSKIARVRVGTLTVRENTRSIHVKSNRREETSPSIPNDRVYTIPSTGTRERKLKPKVEACFRDACTEETIQSSSRLHTSFDGCSLQPQVQRMSSGRALGRETQGTTRETTTESEIPLNDTVSSYSGSNEFFKTASARIKEGRTLNKIGVPEVNFQLIGTNNGARNTGCLDVARRRTSAARLVETSLPPPRTSAPRRGGMSSRDHDHDHDLQVGGKRRMLDRPRRV
ncbi:hypothetical protein Y032_0126g1347 [Ancylostoma ceylanicum]|uniref:CCHC-type domain-containing protein n=1 Tax=Ancylostoma ceylanicum TaxID=53326 RepID=A0A016T8J1_9BILA|nr:hypothetical protein Y032_0126g1347 [Ancylostoma ceylanicum]